MKRNMSEATRKIVESFGASLMQEADIVAKFGDSFDSLRCQVRDALQANINAGVDMDCDGDGVQDIGNYCWVQDLYPAYVCYSMNGNSFACSWIRANGTITLGDPFPVESAYITKDSPNVEESHREVFRESSRGTTAYDATKGMLTVRVIEPGFNKSKERFYPTETLKRDYKVFEGAKMFADHQTESESTARPEGSVNKWVASLKKVWVEESGVIMGEAVVVDPAFKSKLELLSQQNLLTDMGVSIRAIGEASTQTVEGTKTKYVESFLAARSVDFVTYAGAGGRVEAIESSSLADENDVDLITESALRTRRPDLVHVIEHKTKESTLKTIEQQLVEAQTENKNLKQQIAESDKKVRQASATTELVKLLTESKLPEVAAKRIQKQFAEAENTEGMKEAIASEQDYIKSINPTTKNNGAADNATTEADAAKAKPNLVESFKLLGLSEESAKIAANV